MLTTGAAPGQSEDLFQESLARFRANDFRSALSGFEQAYNKTTETARKDLLYYIGYCQLNLGRYAEAFSSLEQALRHRPESWQYRLALATALFHLDRNEEAHHEFSQVRDQKPDSVESHYFLGLLALREGNHSLALDLFKQTLELDRTHRGALFNAGQAAMRLKDTAQAGYYMNRHRDTAEKLDRIKVLEIGAGLSSSNATNWLQLANAYLELAYLDKAAEAFESALRLDPSLGDVHFHLGMVYFELRRWQDSIRSYQAFLESGEKPPEARFQALFNLAQAQRRGGHHEGAVETLRSASAANPASPLPMIAMTEILVASKAWNEALEAAEAATRQFPDQAQGFFLKAYCQLQRAELEDSLQSARRALHLDPGKEAFQSLVQQIELRMKQRGEEEAKPEGGP